MMASMKGVRNASKALVLISAKENLVVADVVADVAVDMAVDVVADVAEVLLHAPPTKDMQIV